MAPKKEKVAPSKEKDNSKEKGNSKEKPTTTAHISSTTSTVIKVQTQFYTDESSIDGWTGRFNSEWLESLNTIPALLPNQLNHSETLTSKVDKKKLHDSPGIYLYIMDKAQVPVGFAYLDCSSFLICKGTVIAQGFIVSKYSIRFNCSITCENPIIATECDHLEPLIVNIKSIKNFPRLPGESNAELAQSNFIYGHIHLGDMKRFVFSSLAVEIYDNAKHGFIENDDTNTLPTQYSTVVLCNLSDRAQHIKEDLQNKSQNISIYSDNIADRVFTPIICRKIANLLVAKQNGEADKLVVSTINTSLVAMASSSPCGRSVLSLASLMAESHDKQHGFTAKRRSDQEGGGPDTAIIARDSVSLSVTTALPPNPLRWSCPDDISLAAATRRVETAIVSTRRSLAYERYNNCSTEIHMTLEFRRRSKESTAADQLIAAPFGRMIIIFQYTQVDVLKRINSAISQVNSKALPNIQGSLRSYELSPEEVVAANNASLDVICGSSVLDDDLRIVILEGLGGPDAGLATAYDVIGRDRPNSPATTILYSPEVRFPSRLYSAFGCDLKRIRVRGGLVDLSRRPEIYDHGVVTMDCYSTIDKLTSLRVVSSLQQAKALDLFPSVSGLESVELLYGETISIEDIDGFAREAGENKDTEIATTAEVLTGSTPHVPVRSRGKVECRNPSFLNSKLKSDFDREARTNKKAAVVEYSQVKAEFMKEGVARVARRIEMAEERSKIPTARLMTETALHHKHWLTPSGFAYPQPRTVAEMATLPGRPSDARVEDLRQPFEDFPLLARTTNPSEEKALRRRERDFKLRIKGGVEFGLNEAPEYQYDFDRNLIGNRQSLPRGEQLKGQDRDVTFFRSIHLGGDEHTKLLEEEIRKEKRLWKSKLLVDTCDFKVAGFTNRTKALQTDRCLDILKGEPKDLSLRMLRSRVSHSGQDLSYKTAPLTIINRDEYVSNRHANVLLKQDDRSMFITARHGGKGEDFRRYIHNNQGVEYKRKHDPLKPCVM